MTTAILILATWRLTSLLVDEDGPWQSMQRIRMRLYRPFPVFECFLCTSLWVGLVCALVWPGPTSWLLAALAYSGGAILLDKVTR